MESATTRKAVKKQVIIIRNRQETNEEIAIELLLPHQRKSGLR